MTLDVKANIGGVDFKLDSKAFILIYHYLRTIKKVYHDDDDEVLQDIEARMAELFTAKGDLQHVVTFDEAKRAIEKIGQPDEFENEAPVTTAESDATPPIKQTDTKKDFEMRMESKNVMFAIELSHTDECDEDDECDECDESDEGDGGNEGNEGNGQRAEALKEQAPPVIPPKLPRKLFRDPNHKAIGGVCSGLAAYFHIDIALVRVIFAAAAIICFISARSTWGEWTVVIIYALLWMIVPLARTPMDFMMMSGERATMRNIGKAVNDARRDGDEV